MGPISRFFRRNANTTALRAADPARGNVVLFGRSQRKSQGTASARPSYLHRPNGSWLVVIACVAFVGYAAMRDGMLPEFLGGSSLVGPLKGGDTIDLREAHILDGGTISFRSERIRISNIGAPEIFEPGCRQEREIGLKAKERLGQLITSGSSQIEREGADANGRTLAKVRTGGTDAGQVLVNEGLALPRGATSDARDARLKHWCG